MSESEPLDFVSSYLIDSITTVLDENGAWEWDFRIIALVTCAFLFLVKATLHKKHGVDWYALIHSTVVGAAATACIYLNIMAAEKMTGVPEPLRTVQGSEPLTSLHKILPAITMGYSILDIIDGLSLGIDFLLHGIVTFSIMTMYSWIDKQNFVTPLMVIEVSTIFLNTMRAKDVPKWVTHTLMFSFFIAFTIYRVLLFPYVWGELVLVMIQESSSPDFAKNNPPHVVYTVVAFGMFFNILHAYWYYKLVRKLIRKLTGAEKLSEKNDYEDKEARNGKKDD